MIEVFERLETKYLLNEEMYLKLMNVINNHLEKDKYFESNIYNIYFDSNDYMLIQNSLEKPIYKEKVRLRSYHKPDIDEDVFLEVKKKYNGIVSKRRVSLKLKDFYEYLRSGVIPKSSSDQRFKEIDYLFNYYRLEPKLLLAYDRKSYFDKDNINFRITFDSNIRSNENNFHLEDIKEEKPYFEERMYIMETKVLGGYPKWFIDALSTLKIYPASFSKYGSIYTKKLKEELNYV